MYSELQDDKVIVKSNSNYSSLMWIFYFVIALYLSLIIPDMFITILPSKISAIKPLISHILADFNLFCAFFLLSYIAKINIWTTLSFRHFKHSFIYAVIANFFISFGMIASKKCENESHTPYAKYQIYVVTLLTPVAEELLFRGFFMRLMENYMSKFKSMLLTSFIFSFLHHKLSFNEHIVIFIFSLWWCFVSFTTKSVYSTIILHFIQNSLVSLTYSENNICGMRFSFFFILFLIGSVFCIVYVYSFPVSLFSEPKTADTSSILGNDLFISDDQKEEIDDYDYDSDDSNSNSSGQNYDKASNSHYFA